ncbi:MAG: hypothetical protein PF961_10830 [Planctomycetota bacterium]|jgi:hypothetical protein|nr:hypothetical protein [Planctomycetota bacterium]
MSFTMPQLTTAQKQQFIDQGFLAVEQVVPQVLINQALRAINHSLGQGRDVTSVAELNARSWCPELGATSTMTDLFNKTPAFQLAEGLIGHGKLEATGSAQVPPRFPRGLEVTDAPLPRGHIDGMGTGTNGIPKGVYRRGFTALCVVLLSDLPEGFMGNFTVWPGSHIPVNQHLKSHGLEVLSEGSPRIDWDIEPNMVTGRAGDVVFAHHLTFHSACANLSPHVRYAAIFRLSHVDCSRNGNDAYLDMWAEYEGLHDLLGYDKPALAG